MTKTPTLLEVPTRIETERLLLRCPEPGDGALVYAGVHDSLAALRQYPASLPWAVFEPSIESSEAYCREGQAKYLLRTEMPMLIFLKQRNIYVGGTGLHAFDWSVPKAETGYWVRSGYLGQGIASEAVSAVIGFALKTLGMRRVEALPDEENLASCGVCERVGMTLEGTLRNDRVEPGGRLRSTRVYAVTQQGISSKETPSE
jgi:hypothetical protein